MGNLLGVLLVYLIFRWIDIKTAQNKKAGNNPNKNPNKKRLTFAEFINEVKTEIEKESEVMNSSANIERNSKKEMEELKAKLKEKHRDKIKKEKLVSADRDIKMRRGEDSLEGKSLEENIPENVCLSKDGGEIFDRVYTKQLNKFKEEREDKHKILLGKKVLETEDISQDDLVKGVLFSEILSKPVSLR